MSDRIYLRGMEFYGRHGVSEEERAEPQVIELYVELALDLRRAGSSDDLADTVDYGEVFELCREHAERRSYRLLEGLAEAVAAAVLSRFSQVEATIVSAAKPGVPIDGVLESAGVRLERSRGA